MPKSSPKKTSKGNSIPNNKTLYPLNKNNLKDSSKSQKSNKDSTSNNNLNSPSKYNNNYSDKSDSPNDNYSPFYISDYPTQKLRDLPDIQVFEQNNKTLIRLSK